MTINHRFRDQAWYRISLWILLLGGILILWQLSKSLLTNPRSISIDDFTCYWAAGKLNLNGENPYSSFLVQDLRNSLQGQAVFPDKVYIPYTPPWTLILLMPFGLLQYSMSRLLWFLVSIGLLIISVNKIWQLYSGAKKYIWMAWLVTFAFAPTLTQLRKGQIVIWVVVGIAGFLWQVERKENDWLAGAFAALLLVKPHLTYLFWPALLLWVLQERRWKVIFAALITYASGLALASAPNPNVIQQYIQGLGENSPLEWFTASLSNQIRIIFGYNLIWLQFLLAVIGLGWLLIFWIQHRHTWNWVEKMPIILLVSILTAPYAWTHDYIILLIPILAIFARLSNYKIQKSTLVLIFLLVLINIVELVSHKFFDESHFFWLATALLLWYLLASWLQTRHERGELLEKEGGVYVIGA
jgi:hypothetical protein